MNKLNLSLAVLAVSFAACNKTVSQYTVVPDPSITNVQVDPMSGNQICSLMYFTNLTYGYGYWSDSQRPSGDYTEANLLVDFVYNIYNYGGTGNAEYPGTMPVEAIGYNGPLPYYHYDIAYDTTAEMVIAYNPNRFDVLVNPTFEGPLDFAAYTNIGDSLNTPDYIYNRGNGEGECGWMTFYTISNGGPGTRFNGTLKVASPENKGHTVQEAKYNVAAEIFADQSVTVNGQQMSQALIQKDAAALKEFRSELTRRMANYSEAVRTTVDHLVEHPVSASAKVMTTAEFRKQISQPDTTMQEAVVKAAMMNSVKSYKNLKPTAQFQKAMDTYAQQRKAATQNAVK